MGALRGSVTLDTSAVIEYLMGTELGRIVKEYFETLKVEERVYCSLYSVSELFYILCRLKGSDFAAKKINEMFTSRVIEINNTTEMALEAGRLKCERAISMGDCSCIATAKITKSQAVFSRKEEELVKEIKRKTFDARILFLAELSQRQK